MDAVGIGAVVLLIAAMVAGLVAWIAWLKECSIKGKGGCCVSSSYWTYRIVGRLIC